MQEPMPIPLTPPRTRVADRAGASEPPTARPKVKKLRLTIVVLGLLLLACISTVWGMMMAVGSDLPALENQAEFRASRNSVLVADDTRGTQLARLTGNNNRILVGEPDISPTVKNAVIAIEDKRFYEHKGVDYQGIARALWQDVRQQRAAQGGSTIAQQFVKNALAAQGNRSVFQKLRESALAYHLERQWTKQKVLTQYLNTVYYGNGAYGIESAVRTYFRGDDAKFDPGQRAARDVEPHEAALLAGMIASPSAYDPVQNPRAAKARRDLVLARMREQQLITQFEYDDAVVKAIPSEADVSPPKPDSAQPYFSTWVTQQLVDRYGAGRVFGGGLRITTTLDPQLQEAAQQAITSRLGTGGLTASLVAVENRTGEVKALVGGNAFDTKPFNLATNGHRQPGSAFKPFTLIAALQQGVGPGKVFTSKKKIFPVPGSDTEKFVVNNYEGQYSGVSTLASATARSDNSVYAELGLDVGTRRIARLAERMGIKTNVSTNPAMTLGGLKEGVTPLEMAFAYSTIANRGRRVSGSLASSELGPVAIEKVEQAGDTLDENKERDRRVFSEGVGEQTRQLLANVVRSGTGRAAQIGEFAAGKTGTTENYGDAWFVGFNDDITVAVWVGYPDRLRYMKTEFHGGPVAGGTFPAEIWRDFMRAALRFRDAREAARDKDGEKSDAESQLGIPQGAPSAPEESKQDPAPEQKPDEPRQKAPPAPESEPQQPAPAPAPQAPPPTQGEGGGAEPPAAQ